MLRVHLGSGVVVAAVAVEEVACSAEAEAHGLACVEDLTALGLAALKAAGAFVFGFEA